MLYTYNAFEDVKDLYVTQKTYVKYCPLCLSEAIQHQWNWGIRAIAMCPKHEVWLPELSAKNLDAIPYGKNVPAMSTFSHIGYSFKPIDPNSILFQSQLDIYARLRSRATS